MSNDVRGFDRNRRQSQKISRKGDTADARNSQKTGISDNVEVTDMTSQLKSLEQILAKQPDVDQDHVNRVRDAIHRGEYQVNPDRVADKMMGFKEDNK